MAESSAPGPASQKAENLRFSAAQRDHRPSSKPMIRKALAALLGALLLQVAFGAAYEIRQVRERAPAMPAPRVSAAPMANLAPSGAPVPVTPAALESPACPRGMVLVEGEYCSEVLQACARWLDDESLPFARCSEYHHPSRCIGKRVNLRFCMDRYEYTEPGQDLPLNYQSFQTSSAVCERLGKRLCTESEWTFACEGEEMRPYPYGFSREAKCNQDRLDLYEPNPHQQILADRREQSDARPECVSPFGVYNLVGNMDESVLREGREHVEPFRNALKGGWWMPARNRCRPATTAHDDYYKDIQVGTRCCAQAPEPASLELARSPKLAD
jgi:formylglycine-generating enzyme